ncbi:S1 family peptidase [Lentzea sp. JNUCC 0626]|uniref:S1 family peptidase n=1 Tax=unclassified Lentzea TaxID=2643253 RepID=UPI003747D7CE
MRVMTAIAGAFLAAFTLASPTASAAPEDPGMSPMIIGGGNASNFPYAARLFVNGRENCSATKIAPRWILTAEHCVASSGTYTFRAGSLDQTSGGQLVTGTRIIKHPSADLALVQVSTNMNAPFSPLAGSSDGVATGQTVQLYGWGATCTNQPEINCQSRYLKVANTRVTNPNGTDYRGGRAISVQRIDGIAAGGDSGGPMFGAGKQVGVASTSDRSTRSNYTRIATYRSWITSNAGV